MAMEGKDGQPVEARRSGNPLSIVYVHPSLSTGRPMWRTLRRRAPPASYIHGHRGPMAPYAIKTSPSPMAVVYGCLPRRISLHNERKISEAEWKRYPPCCDSYPLFRPTSSAACAPQLRTG